MGLLFWVSVTAPRPMRSAESSRVQGFHNSPCKWTDALVVRPGLRVCFALMALSHGPTNSLEICFFNWRALVLTSSWTHSLDFHLFLLFFFFSYWLVLFHGIGPTLHEMPGAFGICWNHLRIFFLVHVGEAQAVQWKFDGFVVSHLCSALHFFFCTWTRLDCLIHLTVLLQLLDNTLSSENIRNMCPSETSDVFSFFQPH